MSMTWATPASAFDIFDPEVTATFLAYPWHHAPLNPRRLAQRLVHARLPAGALRAEGGDDVVVEAERNLRLGRARRGSWLSPAGGRDE
jgi:hypothetical protein